MVDVMTTRVRGWVTDIKTCFAIELAAANPSAEETEDMGGQDEGPKVMVHDIEEAFQLQWLKVDESGSDMKPSKEAFRAHLRGIQTLFQTPSSLEYLQLLSAI